MSNKVLCICVALSCCFLAIQAQQKIDKVSVTVYYESLCPDSKTFFTSQLYPTLVTPLGEWVNLTLVPYGKSSESPVDGQVQFTCDHGPYECYGNKLHACAINNIAPNSNTEYGFNNITVATINCLMDKVNKTNEVYDFPTQYCSTMNHVPDYIQSIENCVGHPQGSEYLTAMGSLTKGLEPPLKNVPTIVINGKVNSDAEKKFKEQLCANLKAEVKPQACSGCSLVVSSLALVLIFLRQLF